MRALAVGACFLVLAAPATAASRTLDGSGNNVRHPAWGAAGTIYPRIAPPDYADGIGSMVAGPSPRYVSNRIFNDVGQNLFSENDVTQWGWAWAQFVDHDIGLADERRGEAALALQHYRTALASGQSLSPAQRAAVRRAIDRLEPR